MESRVLAVDGGQSGIRVRHSLRDDVVEVEGVSHQDGETIDRVAGAVMNAWERLGSPTADRVVLGLTTAPVDPARSERLCRLVAEPTRASNVWLADDAVTAHVGALSGCPGISLVAGTGVACLALPPAEEPRIIGGHGYLLGDEGGGFWIGRRGLGAALRAGDGRGQPTALTERAEWRYGALADVPIQVHGAPRPVDAIARFAPDVLDAAAAGDVVAGQILDEAARELMFLVAAAVGWVRVSPAPLAPGGRLLAPGSELRRRLDVLLSSSTIDVAPREPDGSPLDGALALGLMSDPGRYHRLVHVWRRRRPA